MTSMDLSWGKIFGAVLAIGVVLAVKKIRSLTPNLIRDVQYIRLISKLRKKILGPQCLGNPKYKVVEYWYDHLPSQSNSPAITFIHDDGTSSTLTYDEVERRSNQVSNWALAQGLRPRDVVALDIPNCLEFVIIWLGLAKAGITSSLLNTNVVGPSLKHAIESCNANSVIVHESINTEHHKEVFSQFKHWVFPAKWNETEFNNFSESKVSKKLRKDINNKEVVFYIYTSGTTGYPKAAKFPHGRFITGGMGFSSTAQGFADQTQVLYSPLPLYHSAAGVIAVSCCWATGSHLVIRKKFSASSFWKDCIDHKVTVIQYIGEICRYLLNSPPSEKDKNHQVKLAMGNGLRTDVWTQFTSRFNIPNVFEYYAATEGNSNFTNFFNRVGAVGFIPPLIRKNYPIRIVKYDSTTGDLVKGKDGFCVECPPGQVGEVLGLVEKDADPARTFAGYTDQKATEKKLVNDVFQKGDTYFRTGDLLMCDSEGFLYFVDRVGDTFRWKGENVSTNEVGDVVIRSKGVREANVYGVAVPGHDGRAGMVAVIVDDTFDLQQMYEHTSSLLPLYANPYFVRITKEMDITGTYKQMKVAFVEAGCDPKKVKEPLYFRDDKNRKYVPLDEKVYEEIVNGNIKF